MTDGKHPARSQALTDERKRNQRGEWPMPYAVLRLYTGTTAAKAEEVAGVALRDLAPRLAEGPGLVRYATIAFSDGRVGSFSLYNRAEDAKRGQQIAADWVKGGAMMQGLKLQETMEGEVGFAVQGTASQTGRLHAIARIYRSDASMQDVKTALESEGASVIRSWTGLARYSAAKLADGRVGIFAAFDTAENARKSSEQAKSLRTKAGSQIGRVLPSDPEVIEGTIIGAHMK